MSNRPRGRPPRASRLRAVGWVLLAVIVGPACVLLSAASWNGIVVVPAIALAYVGALLLLYGLAFTALWLPFAAVAWVVQGVRRSLTAASRPFAGRRPAGA